MCSSDLVQEALVRLGWTAADLRFAAVATKAFSTVVGDREAVVYFHPFSFSPRDTHWWLSGTYWSEGINALSNLCRPIPIAASLAELGAHVASFVNEAEAKIDQTYARSLVIRH